MTELETMQRAKTYIDKLANGVDPLTDLPVRDDDVINNVRISRCLFYVSGVLGRLIQNNGEIKPPKKKKEAFRLTDGQLARFRFSDEPIPISEITRRFNELDKTEDHTQLKHTVLTKWLIGIGALREITRGNGTTRKDPTEQGRALGILTEQRTSQNQTYTVVLYNRQAQQFLVDHLPAILEEAATQKADVPAAPLTPDTPVPILTKAEENQMIDLYLSKTPLADIAAAMRLSENGVKLALKKLGF